MLLGDDGFEFEEGAEAFDFVEVDARVIEDEDLACFADDGPDGERGGAEAFGGLFLRVDFEGGDFRFGAVGAFVVDELDGLAELFTLLEAT